MLGYSISLIHYTVLYYTVCEKENVCGYLRLHVILHNTCIYTRI